MKTLLVSVLFAVAVGACSSDNSSTLATTAGGTVPQGGACTQSTDCESGGLTCAYAINSVNGSAAGCKATGVCVAMGQCDYELVCPCNSSTLANVCVTPTYSSVPINPSGCAGGGGGDSGTTTTPPAGDAATGG
ncbi:MAG: hypothetical protein ACLQVI_42950 [Polyangiaceae bacterium]|jgi:hypothetical protein